MGAIFSQKCDLCGSIQSEEDPTKIKGTSVMMNGVTRFVCGECRSILDTAFVIQKDGLRDTVLAMSKLVKENTELKRLLAQASVRREDGDLGLISVDMSHREAQRWNGLTPQERFKPENAIQHRPAPSGKLTYGGGKKPRKK